MVELFANSEDPDQTPHYAASVLGLHCLLITRLGVSRLQWVNNPKYLDKHARANGVDLDQTPHNAACDQGLNCLPLVQQYF